MTCTDDYWAEDDFEDTVAAALIACFETKVKKNRGAAPADRLNEARVAMLRAQGPYIASNSRVILAPDPANRSWAFDLTNDRLPLSGVHAFRPGGLVAADNPAAYLCVHGIRQATGLGRYWHKRAGGTLYEMLTVAAENDGLAGERRFFVVTRHGDVVACTQQLPTVRGPSPFGAAVRTVGPSATWLHETEAWASATMQFLADRRFCWTITAQEKSARAHLGCMGEEVKSLLYARSLPMTATGRKRPILHLVEAHKRRMRNGTDIDVSAFLRGQQIVEIGGTIFMVNPPPQIRPAVSAASRARYFAPVELGQS